jgi:hypothetical protein
MSAKKPAKRPDNDRKSNYEGQVEKIQTYLEEWKQIRKKNKGDIQNPQSEGLKKEIASFFKDYLNTKDDKVSDLIDQHYMTVYRLLYDIYILNMSFEDAKSQAGNKGKPSMTDIKKGHQSVVYIQSFFRMKLALHSYKKRLREKKQDLQDKLSRSKQPEEACMRDFATQLGKKNLTPEAFFRVCDQNFE